MYFVGGGFPFEILLDLFDINHLPRAQTKILYDLALILKLILNQT